MSPFLRLWEPCCLQKMSVQRRVRAPQMWNLWDRFYRAHDCGVLSCLMSNISLNFLWTNTIWQAFQWIHRSWRANHFASQRSKVRFNDAAPWIPRAWLQLPVLLCDLGSWSRRFQGLLQIKEPLMVLVAKAMDNKVPGSSLSKNVSWSWSFTSHSMNRNECINWYRIQISIFTVRGNSRRNPRFFTSIVSNI